MGRQLRRVPLDFEWPINKVWEGFLNPNYEGVQCEACEGTGLSPFAHHLQKLWYGTLYEDVSFDPRSTGSEPFTSDHPVIRALAERNCSPRGDSSWYYGSGATAVEREAQRLANHFNASWSHHLSQADVDALAKGGRLFDFTRTWTPGEGWVKKDPPYHPTAKEVNEWSLSGMGHDSINQWIVVRDRCRRAHKARHCKVCKGHGDIWPSEETRQRYENFEPAEPPTGDGYQMWENVSEGSPISPVFATPEGLAGWLVNNRPQDGSFESWMQMICGDGWAPSMMMVGGKIMSGVEAMGTKTVEYNPR